VTGPLPGHDLAGYLREYPREMACTAGEPGEILDRYHSRGFELRNDGRWLDRDDLLAHAQAGRRNADRIDVDVHEVVRDGDRVAARYTLRALMRRGRIAASEIFMFGVLDPDGRLRRVEQLTRIVPDPDAA
jgi:SnoaL-like domain